LTAFVDGKMLIAKSKKFRFFDKKVLKLGKQAKNSMDFVKNLQKI